MSSSTEPDQGAAREGRVPPQDLAAEQSTLGGMLLSKEAVGDVAEILTADAFYAPKHTAVFTAIIDLYNAGEPADPISVAARLLTTKQLAKVGGAPYLHTLTQMVPTAANAGYYARIVADRALLRKLTEAAARISQMAYEGGDDTPAILDRSEQTILEVGDQGRSADTAKALGELLMPAMDELEALADRKAGQLLGIPTGILDLDRLLGGFQPGQLIIIAGRPAMGKSTLALNALQYAARQGTPGVLFSLEMSQLETVIRVLSAENRIPLQDLRTGQLDDSQWTKLAKSLSSLDEWPLYIDETADMSLMEIRSKARRLQQREGIKLLAVDYLQLMTSPGRKNDNREQEVASFSRGLKLLAKELQIPVIAVAQLNRGPEQRADKRPMLADLRDSGSLEQDADVVIFVHRDDYYDKESPRAGEADLIVAKHRNGPTDTIAVAAQLQFSRFVDMAVS